MHIQSSPVHQGLIQAGFAILQGDKSFKLGSPFTERKDFALVGDKTRLESARGGLNVRAPVYNDKPVNSTTLISKNKSR